MEGTIILVRQTFKEDPIGQQVPEEETQTEVFCTIRSVTRNEWRDAGQNNIRAELVAVTPLINYSGERIAIVDGRRKAIYRTYMPPDSDEIELYMQDEGGEL